MPTRIGDVWESMSNFWKGAVVLFAVAVGSFSLALNFIEYKNLPTRVTNLEVVDSLVRVELNEMRRLGWQRDRAIDEVVDRLDRVLCYQEAMASESSALRCSR